MPETCMVPQEVSISACIISLLILQESNVPPYSLLSEGHMCKIFMYHGMSSDFSLFFSCS